MRRELKNPCKETGKVAYRNQDAAEWARAKIRRKFEEMKGPHFEYKPTYPYLCSFCEHWHLSSQRPNHHSDNRA